MGHYKLQKIHHLLTGIVLSQFAPNQNAHFPIPQPVFTDNYP